MAACARLIEQGARPDASLLSAGGSDLWHLVAQDLREERRW
jgi:hypothetical protein